MSFAPPGAPGLPMGMPPAPPGGMGMPPLGPMPAPPMPPMEPPPVPASREQRRTARLRPFELPPLPEKTPAKPKADWIIAQREQRQSHWRVRNEQMDLDLAMYLMNDAVEVKTTGDGGEEVITRVTPRASVDKVANMASGQKDKIRCVPRSQAQHYRDAAQAVEDFLYDDRRQIDKKWQAGMNMGYAHDEAWFCAGLGWVVSRECLDPGDQHPIRSELFDPRKCYGTPAGEGIGQLADMLYHEETDKATLLHGNPKLVAKSEKIGALDDDADVKVTWYEDAFWTVVLLEDEEVFAERHDYGFCPWIMVPVAGTPLKDKESRGQFGAGIIRALRATFKYDDRLHGQVGSMVARAANPPSIMVYDSSMGGVPKPIDLRPGARNTLDAAKGERYEPIQAMERPDQVAMMARMAATDISRQGVDGMLLGGEGTQVNSGFQFNIQRYNAEDVLRPTIKAIKTHREWQHRIHLMLLLVADRDKLLMDGTDEEESRQGVIFMQPNREAGRGGYSMSRGSKHVYSILTAEDIALHGIESEVVLNNMTPQDRMQAIAAAAQAVQTKLFSRHRAWDEILEIDDPDQENLMLAYEAMMIEDEEMMREYNGPRAVQAIDPEMWGWMERRRMQREAEALAMQRAQQAAMEQQQAMLPPPPPPGEGPPLPGLGLDSTILPPQMQPGTGVPGAGDPLAILAQLAEPTVPLP
jgi:hypothetical protein